MYIYTFIYDVLDRMVNGEKWKQEKVGEEVK